jgi:calcineurin-like phosphoesterase family protein
MGDISSGSSGGQRAALAWFAERPGRKRLIKGNHDGPFAQNQDRHKWHAAYHEVFETVEDYGRYKIAGHKVMLSHFPYTGDHEEPDRYQQYRLRPINLPVIHGHTHSDKRFGWSTPETGSLLQIHIGVDAWSFRPVHLDEVIAILEENTLT